MICPYCTTFNDPAISPSGRIPPKDWDPVMCVGCHQILTIDHTASGGVRPPDDDDWAAWHSDRRLLAALTALQTQRNK